MIEVASFAWLLAGTGDTIAASFYDDGAPVDPGTVTVDITDAVGAAIATARATQGTGATARTVALAPAETALPDLLALTWHATIGGVPMDFATTAEIVGALPFTVAEARAFDKQQLANGTKYPSTTIAEARARICDAFARICGAEFVPRYRRVVLDGQRDMSTWDWLRDPLQTRPVGREIEIPDQRVVAIRRVETRVAGAATWDQFTDAQLADVILTPEGTILRETLGAWPFGRQNIRVGYVAGHAQTPADIRRAMLILLVDQLVAKDLTDRALSITSQEGTFRIATAGERGSYFGLPLVDSVLDLYVRERVPVIG